MTYIITQISSIRETCLDETNVEDSQEWEWFQVYPKLDFFRIRKFLRKGLHILHVPELSETFLAFQGVFFARDRSLISKF